MRHVIITGGRGYIGAALVDAALVRGWYVTSLERRQSPSRAGRLYRLPWHLRQPLPREIMEQPVHPDAIIHAAHEWDTDGSDDDPNHIGTITLLRSAHMAAIQRFLFVSSVSARPAALNVYGRSKWQIERVVTEQHGIAVRVGLVYGGARRAQYGALARLAKIRILPMIASHKAVQPIHIDEVCEGLLALSVLPNPSRSIYVFASPIPITFKKFLQTLARELHARRLLVVPIPTQIALLLCNLSRHIHMLPKINRERVLGLRGMQFVDGGDGLSEIGVTLVPMSIRLLSEPVVWIPLLLREARALLHYCLGATPPAMLLRRYARAVRMSSKRDPLPLPVSVLRCPWMLRFVEPLPRGGSVLTQRTDLATRLAENCSVGADRFFAYRGSRLRMLSGVVLQMSLDFLAIAFRLLARHR